MTAVLFASLLLQVVDFLREVANFSRQKSAVLTQLTAWVGGVVLVTLGAHAAVASRLVLPGSDMALGKLDGASIVLLGMLVSSFGSSLVDFKQSLDAHDSAAKPPLLPAAPSTP